MTNVHDEYIPRITVRDTSNIELKRQGQRIFGSLHGREVTNVWIQGIAVGLDRKDENSQSTSNSINGQTFILAIDDGTTKESNPLSVSCGRHIITESNIHQGDHIALLCSLCILPRENNEASITFQVVCLRHVEDPEFF